MLKELKKSIFGRKKSGVYQTAVRLLKNRYGLEIGGYSNVFSKGGFLPVYEVVESLDNCNYSARTVWEGNIDSGNTYEYSRSKSLGKQYILEATDLCDIQDNIYDFIISSHVLEHIANPVKAIKEWMRVLKPKGALLLVIPEKDGTFDHNRPVTLLSHIKNDFDNEIPESDETHFREVIELHDIHRDSGIASKDELLKRVKSNFNNRCLHHHVFDLALLVQLIDYCGMDVIMVEKYPPCHIICLAINKY